MAKGVGTGWNGLREAKKEGESGGGGGRRERRAGSCRAEELVGKVRFSGP
jgi:hypothetical protein